MSYSKAPRRIHPGLNRRSQGPQNERLRNTRPAYCLAATNKSLKQSLHVHLSGALALYTSVRSVTEIQPTNSRHTGLPFKSTHNRSPASSARYTPWLLKWPPTVRFGPASGFEPMGSQLHIFPSKGAVGARESSCKGGQLTMSALIR